MTRLCNELVPPGNSIPWEIPKGILRDMLGEQGALLVPLNPLAGGGGTGHRGGWSERVGLCYAVVTTHVNLPGALWLMKPPIAGRSERPQIRSSHNVSRLNTNSALETGVTGGFSSVGVVALPGGV